MFPFLYDKIFQWWISMKDLAYHNMAA
jgi:hypothetical protein